MKICILTQTANDISDYYKTFFKGMDLFFVTFSQKNPAAIDYLPKSTWSDGRNRLWDEVKGKYDYYLFIDDDLIFYESKFKSITQLQYLLEQKFHFEPSKIYKESKPENFFSKLNSYLKDYKPEVLSIRNLNNLTNKSQDLNALKHGHSIRRLAWFDAQFTLLSNFAANRLLPYDTHVSGWASAQILIYLMAYHVFGSKSLGVITLGANNTFHTGPYVPDYKSNLDCKNMVTLIADTLGEGFNDLFDLSSNHVNLFYGNEKVTNFLPSQNDQENFNANFNNSILGIEKMLPKNNLNFSAESL